MKKNYICIFLHSGSYDRIYHALSIAMIAQAQEKGVHIFCSFDALKKFKKGAQGIKKGGLEPLPKLIKEAKELGRLKIYACAGSMSLLNISRDELIEEVDRSMGLTAFLNLAYDAQLVLYI